MPHSYPTRATSGRAEPAWRPETGLDDAEPVDAAKMPLTYASAMAAATPLVRWWARLQVIGQDLLPASGATVLMVNHDSALDPVVGRILTPHRSPTGTEILVPRGACRPARRRRTARRSRRRMCPPPNRNSDLRPSTPNAPATPAPLETPHLQNHVRRLHDVPRPSISEQGRRAGATYPVAAAMTRGPNCRHPSRWATNGPTCREAVRRWRSSVSATT
jgi:hypothetical protein